MIVDAKNGKVHSGIGSERGIEIRIDSNLYIVDPPYPPEAIAYPDQATSYLPVQYYVWDGKGLQLIYEESCTVIERRQVCGSRSP